MERVWAPYLQLCAGEDSRRGGSGGVNPSSICSWSGTHRACSAPEAGTHARAPQRDQNPQPGFVLPTLEELGC